MWITFITRQLTRNDQPTRHVITDRITFVFKQALLLLLLMMMMIVMTTMLQQLQIWQACHRWDYERHRINALQLWTGAFVYTTNNRTTPGTTGNLIEFEIPLGNLEFCCCSRKNLTQSCNLLSVCCWYYFWDSETCVLWQNTLR